MSDILSQHLNIDLGANRSISFPRAQILHLRHLPKPGAHEIHLRVSKGELVLKHPNLDDLWVRLVNGEVQKQLCLGADFTSYTTNLARELQPEITVPKKSEGNAEVPASSEAEAS